MPAPPRRGKVTREQAAARLVELAGAAKADVRACERDIDEMVGLVLQAYPRLDDKDPRNVEAWLLLQDCAIAAQYWQTALDAAYEILDHSRKLGRPHNVVQALIALGELELADEELRRMLREVPGAQQDMKVGAMAARLACARERYDQCYDVAKATWAMLVDHQSDPTAGATAGSLLNSLVTSAYFSGRFEDAKRFLAHWEKLRVPGVERVAAVRKQVLAAELHGVVVEAISPPRVPLGAYHLYGNQPGSLAGPFLTLKLWNYTGKDAQFRVEAQIPSVTEKGTLALMVEAGKREDFRLSPALVMDLDVRSVRAERPAQLRITVTRIDADGERLVLDHTREITLLPRDYLPLGKQIAADVDKKTYEYVGAWITPNVPAVETFLTAAKQRHPRRAFVGEQGPTVPQVRALYEELQSHGVTYVMDPSVMARDLVQRTRLPAEVLSTTNAQCLEGTILFATLMESIGLRPVLVFVPGHAFVGWHTTAKEKSLHGMLFVETTMVGDAPFGEALDVATNRVVDELEAGAFKRGESTLLELDELRRQGVTPQPTAL